MRRITIGWLKATLCALLLGLQVAHAAPAALPGPLVDVAWLQQALARPEHGLLLLDASPTAAYKKQHIAGAVHVDLFSYAARQAPPAEMQRLLQAWGISASRRIVIYDEGGGYGAPRLFYDLMYRGFPVAQMALLDGGLVRWQAQGGAVTAAVPPAPAPGDFRVTQLREELRVRLPEFLAGSGDPQRHALVEALGPSWHFGESAFFGRGGHVPNAVMLPDSDFFNADKTFKSPAEMRRMLAYFGVRPEQQVYSHCGGGLAAAVPFFALKLLLGYPTVKLYQESQLEWLRDDRELPFWTYDAPYLLRDSAWLKVWGGGIVRSYGLSQVSIVDVRSPALFAQGHLPFAVNVPAELFRRHLQQPGQLAALLGQAGVAIDHEAVIVSDAGLDPQAALAFVALQRLGQARVSVFTDSLLGWAERGGVVDSGAGKPPTARSYTPQPPPAAAPAIYPRVTIASGAKPPAPAAAGTVHLPYAQLLDAEGRPQPAKTLWKRLADAGVPRYAELVAVADDPAEAAVAVLLLQLMGFPDVKLGSP